MFSTMFAHVNVIGNAFHDCQITFNKTIVLGTRGNDFPHTV